MKNRTIVLFTHAALLLVLLNDTIARYTVDRYEGSRREAFIQRFEGWWKAIRRAYRYGRKAKHRYRRFQRNVSQNTPDSARVYTVKDATPERYTGKRRNPDNSAHRGIHRMPRNPWNLLKDTSPAVPCRDIRTPDGLICVPVSAPPAPATAPVPVAVDPWHEYMLRQQRNNELTLTGREGPHQNVTHTASVLGRRPDPTGENPGTAQQMLPRQGGSDHHRSGGQAHRGGGLQWPAIRIPARRPAVYAVVSESRSDSGESYHGAVSGVRRLSVAAR